MKRYPVFHSHNAVECFNCERTLDPKTVSESNYANGSGGFKAYCPDCDLLTFYDLSAELPTATARNRARALAVAAAAVFAAIIFTITPNAAAAQNAPPKTTPKTETKPALTAEQIAAKLAEIKRGLAEVHAMQVQHELITNWEQCLAADLSQKQLDYLDTLTAHDAQRYLLAIGGDDRAECKLNRLDACERLYPGECIAPAPDKKDAKADKKADQKKEGKP